MFKSDWRKLREGGAWDSTQYLAGIIMMGIGAGILWGWGGALIVCGIAAQIDIRLDDTCNSLSNK